VLTEDVELIALPLGEEGVAVSLFDLTQLVDPDATAARVLTPPEWGEYTRLGHPARRREWVGARVCLKTMLVRAGLVADPQQCAIMKDAGGRPWVSLASGRPGGPVYDCSLAHKGPFACAGASRESRIRIGVDVEAVSPRLSRVAGAFAGDRDEALGARAPEERLAMLWALKEACAKAAGGGIGVALGGVVSGETAPGRFELRTGDGRGYRAWCVLRAGYAVALCLGEGQPT